MKNQRWRKKIVDGIETMELIEEIELPDRPIIKTTEEKVDDITNSLNKERSKIENQFSVVLTILDNIINKDNWANIEVIQAVKKIAEIEKNELIYHKDRAI